MRGVGAGSWSGSDSAGVGAQAGVDAGASHAIMIPITRMCGLLLS